jgi:hypothetical protein
MIGKIILSKNYSNCIRYCLDDKKNSLKHRGEILYYNNCFGNKNDLIFQFNEVGKINSHTERKVWHHILSFAPEDKLERHQIVEIANKCAKEFDFQDNQYILIQHNDTKFTHVHIVANRIGYNSKIISDSNNYKRIANFCRKMEQEYNLTKVLNPRKFQSKEERLIQRKDKRKDALKQSIKEILINCKSIPEFSDRMTSKGYKTEIGRGIAFIDDKKVRFKGSQVGFSWNEIKQAIIKNISVPLNIDNPKNLNLSL